LHRDHERVEDVVALFSGPAAQPVGTNAHHEEDDQPSPE